MCTSTSPISERTALLWGRHWWLAGRPEPLGFENLTHAAKVLAAHLANEPHPVRLRLIYQPDSLSTVPVACPLGSRAALQSALASDHPAITDPAHAWGHEPVLPLREGYTTLLHYENEPGLLSLVASLAQSGVNVSSAWPLATFLQALPKELSETGSSLVLAYAEDHDCALAYHHPADGCRTVNQWDGPGAVADALTWLEGEKARLSDDPALLVIPMEDVDPADPARLPLHEALAAPVVLPRAHPAQLLPAVPFITAQRAAIAASILLLFTAGWSGAAYAREFNAWSHQQQAAAQEKSALRAEIEHYRINAAEIVAFRSRLTGPGSSPPVGEWLDAVCRTLLPELAFDHVRVAQGRFTLTGHVAPGATAAWSQWRGRLESRRWKLEESPPLRETGAFTINGVFTP